MIIMWKSDSTAKEDLLQEVIIKFESREQLYFPELCPICESRNVHLYYNRFKGDRGGLWVWCSECKYYIHGSHLLPKWWINDNRVQQESLTSEPDILEKYKDKIDTYVNQFVM